MNLAVDFANDLVANEPLKYCGFLEGVFAENVFGFKSRS